MFSNSGLLKQDHWRDNKSKISEVLNSSDLRFIGFADNKPLMNVSSGLDINYFTKAELPTEMFSKTGEWQDNWVFLGTDADGQTPIIALEMSDLPESLLESWRENNIKPVDLRSCAMQLSIDNQAPERAPEQASVLAAGKSLLDWHNRHGFCAECGHKTKLVRAGHQRRCTSDDCKAEHFPRTDPVVIMLVLYDDKCLLGRSPHFTEGSFSALAGFLEQGETIEEAVAREVMEEVGLEVGNVKYVVSQPWPFPSSLMIGCFAEAKGTNFIIDENELEEARWFSKDEIELGFEKKDGLDFSLPPSIAVAHNLLQNWLQSDKK